jgi:hypothetical protein
MVMINIKKLIHKYNKRIPSIIGIIFILFIIFNIIKNRFDDNEIRENMKLTTAVITGVRPGRSGELLEFNYSVNGIKYEGLYQLYIGYKNASLLINSYLPVVYSGKNPKKRELLVHPNRFKKYNINYPDSIWWVKELIEKNED